jgi:hypothetical protein
MTAMFCERASVGSIAAAKLRRSGPPLQFVDLGAAEALGAQNGPLIRRVDDGSEVVDGINREC